MARYFFDIHDGVDATIDEEGIEFADLDRVQQEAAFSLADMARDAVRGKNWFIAWKSASATIEAL